MQTLQECRRRRQLPARMPHRVPVRPGSGLPGGGWAPSTQQQPTGRGPPVGLRLPVPTRAPRPTRITRPTVISVRGGTRQPATATIMVALRSQCRKMLGSGCASHASQAKVPVQARASAKVYGIQAKADLAQGIDVDQAEPGPGSGHRAGQRGWARALRSPACQSAAEIALGAAVARTEAGTRSRIALDDQRL